MNGGSKEGGRQSKTMEINNLLQQILNYSNETRVIAEDLSITLFQERAVPEDQSEAICPGAVLSQDPNKMGWFDTVIKKLLNIKHTLENTGMHLSKISEEVVIK